MSDIVWDIPEGRRLRIPAHLQSPPHSNQFAFAPVKDGVVGVLIAFAQDEPEADAIGEGRRPEESTAVSTAFVLREAFPGFVLAAQAYAASLEG
jgi:hypothetical protein